MGIHEDTFYEIYHKVEEKGIKDKFDKQLEKMSLQKKHKYKTVVERWEYALMRVTQSISK
tara:strand:+ start:2269 stop:2448 length:180 start_codon:yes stop_codon:yes gene_type:complete